ncbi:hypothetical protein E3N88_23109 [Mikania micrantha]|uniref:Uncharacterized protein n=1 Tax=Mikania micrantha TaxID=192012 RepID=A0A5N6NF15_9ASTR|nr:hypothetical protein E3N88_23109 [Mikania micrantha]
MWEQQPNNRCNNTTTPTENRLAQAHLADVDPLEPTQLANAVQALLIEPDDDQWYLDTGASSHVTYDTVPTPKPPATENVNQPPEPLLPINTTPLTPGPTSTGLTHAPTQNSPKPVSTIVPPPPHPISTHSMQTRSKSEIVKPR